MMQTKGIGVIEEEEGKEELETGKVTTISSNVARGTVKVEVDATETGSHEMS